MSKGDEKQNKSGKLLFVDDEINILRSVQREFFQSDFVVYTAQSAKEGLKILEDEDIDIVVSDYRMPEVDGFEFLQKVKERHPSVHRIILSGFMQRPIVVKSLATGLASSYFIKPWIHEELERKIKHILHVKALLKSKQLYQLINNIVKLPSLPHIYQEFTAAIAQEKSISEISEVVTKDPAIAAKVLQIANSAFYGSKTYSTTDKAITVLGLEALNDIVLTLSMITNMKWNQTQSKHLKEIITHSLLVNSYVTLFFERKIGKPKNIDLPSVGLTHDIGKIIILQYYPDRYETTMEYQRKNSGLNFYEAEIRLGFHENTHAEIGAYFLDYWNLPEPFLEVALFHHTPEGASVSYKNIVEVAYLVNRLMNYLWDMRNEKKLDLSQFQCDYIPRDELEGISLKIIEKMKEGIGI